MEPVKLRTHRDDAYINLIEQAMHDVNDMLHGMYEKVRPAFFSLPPEPGRAALALKIAGVGEALSA